MSLAKKDFALPERHAREDNEDEPHDTDDGGHDGMDSVEALDVQCITEGTHRRYPTDCK